MEVILKQSYLRDNLQGYVTLQFRPSEGMIIDLVSWKFWAPHPLHNIRQFTPLSVAKTESDYLCKRISINVILAEPYCDIDNYWGKK